MTARNILMAAAGNTGDVMGIEDVFSTWLYRGNSSTQTINNGIDLAGKGGLVWIKSRSAMTDHFFFDTNRGAINEINCNSTGAQASLANSLTSFNANGFSVGGATGINTDSTNYTSWAFRKQPKFFDVVTYTGNGDLFRQLVHNLGSTPGAVFIKATSTTDNWFTLMRTDDSGSTRNYSRLILNSSAAQVTTSSITGDYSNTFPVGLYGSEVNTSGVSYVAYLFAHNAGGFGESGTDNVISCGTFTTNSSGIQAVNLGYEPQWVLIKRVAGAGNWLIVDNMRSFPHRRSDNDFLYYLQANNNDVERDLSTGGLLSGGVDTSGFFVGNLAASASYIYIAIRRGPMKVPVDGTKVFDVQTSSSTNATLNTLQFDADALLAGDTNNYLNKTLATRLFGEHSLFFTNETSQEFVTGPSAVIWTLDKANQLHTYEPTYLTSNAMHVRAFLRRAPGFFDVVCYAGTGSATTQAHNLGVTPEFMIVKRRNISADWQVYAGSGTEYLVLNSNAAKVTGNSDRWNSTAPTSSVFNLGTNAAVNITGGSYFALLFATCPGVSKVGSYTGNGSSQTINMGFTGGARFFLVKRTDNTGDWWMYDSARGIVAAADPASRLNVWDPDITSADAVDTTSSGIIVNQETTCNINVNGATYIYLGIA